MIPRNVGDRTIFTVTVCNQRYTPNTEIILILQKGTTDKLLGANGCTLREGKTSAFTGQ
jgi:hypothetical protein